MRQGILAVAAISSAILLAACTPEAPDFPAAPAIPPAPEGLTPSAADILDPSPASDWRWLDPENTLYMDFPAGRVIIEMAPAFAPNHVANVKALSREGFFVNGAVTRLQDNFVAQWAQAADPPRPPAVGVERLDREFVIPRSSTPDFTVLPDPDTYAPEVGFVDGFAAARNADEMWLTHCYGTVGVGREEDEDSGGGTELYAIIGHSPRRLDRQITVLGRVVQGIEILSSLKRGTGPAGFYETPEEYVRYADIKVAVDLPEDQRTPLEILRTDSETFATLVNSRRWRKDGFYKHPAGRIGVCDATPPVRTPS
jgi:peptidylprolyl isomerase